MGAKGLYFAVLFLVLAIPSDLVQEVRRSLKDAIGSLLDLRFFFPGFNHGKQPLLSPQEMDEVLHGSFISEQFTPPAGRSSFRVVSWNIERGLKYEGILKSLTGELASDVYLLQEVDLNCRRTDYKDIARLLAGEMGMYYVYGIEFQELNQGGSGKPALHGQAIFSRFPVIQARVLRFKQQREDWSRDRFQPRTGGRMVLVAELQTPWGSVITYNTHLESRTKSRGRALQIREILEDIRRQDHQVPVIVAGDLNTRGKGPPLLIQMAEQNGFVDALSGFPQEAGATHESGRLDWILLRWLAPLSARTYQEIDYSDHHPVSAVVQFLRPTPPITDDIADEGVALHER